jgi:hypothetical protein
MSTSPNDTVILSGMPDEKKVLARVFPNTLILSGTDKLNLPALVPPNCARLIVAGLFGGLAPGIPVGSICMAKTIVDKAATIYTCDAAWNERMATVGWGAGFTFGIVSWYSSGLLDEADSAAQRAAMFRKYGAQAIDDEARYAVALATQRPGLLVNDFRSCSDDWTETLPLAATGPIMNADGSADLNYLFRAIATEPAYQTIDLAKVGIDYGKCLSTFETALNAVKNVFLTG